MNDEKRMSNLECLVAYDTNEKNLKELRNIITMSVLHIRMIPW